MEFPHMHIYSNQESSLQCGACHEKNKANRHKSRAASLQRQTDRPTDRQTDQQTDQPTEWLIESRARD